MKKLIKLAKKYNFISKFDPNNSNEEYYWLCDLHKWFRHEHNINIDMYTSTAMPYENVKNYNDGTWNFRLTRFNNINKQETFEIALINGLKMSFEFIE